MKPNGKTYGGQAVIEGVMMRGPRAYAIAVRAPDQSIVIETTGLDARYRGRLVRIPFLRGLVMLWDSLVLGMQALTFSADVQARSEGERIEGAPLVITLLGSLAIGLALFFLLPAGAAYLLGTLLQLPSWVTNVVEGLLRLSLLVGYIGSIGLMPDIRRVYGYHGAEHKTINAYEAGAPLEPEVIERFPREHPRCGTAFLLTVVIFSVLLFSLLGPMPLAQRLVSRILFIPILASLAYEYIRLTVKLMDRRWAKPLIWPNLALQRLTTREPDREMIEVGIASFQAMQAMEKNVAPHKDPEPLIR